MSSAKDIIKESINKDPVSLSEALAEALRARASKAIQNKIAEVTQINESYSDKMCDYHKAAEIDAKTKAEKTNNPQRKEAFQRAREAHMDAADRHKTIGRGTGLAVNDLFVKRADFISKRAKELSAKAEEINESSKNDYNPIKVEKNILLKYKNNDKLKFDDKTHFTKGPSYGRDGDFMYGDKKIGHQKQHDIYLDKKYIDSAQKRYNTPAKQKYDAIIAKNIAKSAEENK